MTGKQNIILIENKKPFETVQELKNEVPSFEEFMESYEVDENLNYDDLTYNDISEVKGYGPCHTCGNRNLRFKLKIVIENWDGVGIAGNVFSTDEAERAAREIRNGTGYWAGSIFKKTGWFKDECRHGLANKVMSEVDKHKNGSSVDTEVSYKDDCSIM